MEHRAQLLIALAITEWASVLAHLEAMRQEHIAIPSDLQIILSRELGSLYRQWPVEADSVDQAISQARRFVTDNLSEAEGFLKGANG